MNQSFDAIVIGAGQAGPPLVTRLAKEGWKVALVERKLLGGTCVNTGCTPTKTLIASAEAIQRTRQGGKYGFTIGPVTVDLARVTDRMRSVVEASRSGLEKSMTTTEGVTLFRGAARFVSPTQVQAGGDTLTAPKIFLNVGARPTIPDLPGVDKIPYLTSSTILELTQVPSHLVVIGGSYIGLEFAQMFRRFGAQVTIVERSARLIGHEDEDASTCIQSILETEGIAFRLNADAISFTPGIKVTTHADQPALEASHVLIATGRTPNINDLNADAAGLAMDKHGYLQVDDQLQTTAPNIWALGDCNGKGAFTHTSYNDYEIVAANLFGPAPRKVTDRIQCHALYTDPPLAQAGQTEAQVLATGRPAKVGLRPMTKVSRAVEKGEAQGFIKILVDAETEKILGATLIGPGADEAIHCILTNMYSGQPASLLTHSVHIHPTVAELIPTTLEDLKPLSPFAKSSSPPDASQQ